MSYAGAGKAELQFGGIFNEDAYVILREEGNTRTTKRIKLAELSSGGFPIKYIDTNLTPGKTYTYYVACSADYGNNYYNSYSSNKITYTAK